MATTKKAPAKKPAVKKAAVKKIAAKPVNKATPKKKTSVKKVSAAKSADLRSFRVSKNEHSFTTFKITRQTIYWIILIAFIIFVQLWILKLQIEVASILESQQVELLQEDL